MSHKDFRIYGSGTGLVVLSVSAGFLWLILIFCTKDIFLTGLDLKKAVIWSGGVLLCIYGTILAFKFWKCNFIKIENGELLISVLKRKPIPADWPKYNKESVRLDNIEFVLLKKPANLISAPSLMVKRKSGKPYYVDTKPFSRAAFWRLFKELEKRGIEVQITTGAI